MSKYEDILNSKGYLITTANGTSMLPLIRPKKDSIFIKKGIPKKYDVVLYKRDDGKYILHRILNVVNDEYVICGDNQFVKEYGINNKHILGVMEGFYRDNRYVDVGSLRYKMYVYIWCKSFRVRRFIMRSFEVINKLR